MTDSPGPVASAVRAEIARAGRNQREAAEAIKKSQQAMSMRLLGRKEFTVSELQTLADWLDVPLAVLLGESHAVPTQGRDARGPRRDARRTPRRTAQAVPA